MEFDSVQKESMNRMKSGSILVGGTGSGKSRTALMYFFNRECGGTVEFKEKEALLYSLDEHKDLYIITTAAKRDKKEWEKEMIPFLLEAKIDSWNNIAKYVDVENSFFIFDEQRVVGSGTWSKSFLKIAKKNRWIMLSATPGDTWSDYIPVFIANGFYKNRTEFYTRHVVWNQHTTYPKIDRYLDEDHLRELKKKILVDMKVQKETKKHSIIFKPDYDKKTYDEVRKNRWNIYDDSPIENASQYVSVLRKIINSDPSRCDQIEQYIREHHKVIIFYNFNYERDLLLEMCKKMEVEVAEWNGHNHESIPNTVEWVYLVQYAAGSEGWECTETDTIIFYSLSYSYRMTIQAAGRIDRRNTKFTDLYYYYLISESPLDGSIQQSLKKKRDFNAHKYWLSENSQIIQPF